MNRNSKLLYCLLGSFILALLNNPIFENSRLGIFENVHGLNWAMIYQLYNLLINILSFLGFILTIVLAINLIIINFNNKK